jgi:DNA-binding winged helix-turn-helix (wHTH) protein
MDPHVTEASYPLSFRKDEAQKLGEYIKQRQSVNLVGMKRVGISNFLRFFLNHNEIVKTYISSDQKHLFIPVDLNDLIEREIYPFWTLVLKRIVDASENSKLPDETKKKINSLFLASIQSQDLFLLIDSIRHALTLISEKDVYVTLFFLRFDRLKDAFNPSFFDNLEGLIDATNERASYVFTSYRSIDRLFPQVKNRLSIFSRVMSIRPANEKDMAIIYDSYKKRYNLELTPVIEQALFHLVNGNVQYLQLALILLNEKKDQKITTEKEFLSVLLIDERITLESEELWESLTKEEKYALLQVAKGLAIQPEEKAKATYLWDTGFIQEGENSPHVFSPLLAHYLIGKDSEDKKTQVVDLTRKEHLLFGLLESQMGEICEREKIIEVVWPEYQEFGVSDWAIDRLVARVRVKLRQQNSPFEIVTVRTRGYKLSVAKE